MLELTCKNCGAPLRWDGKCEYCGSVYKIDPSGTLIVIHEATAQTLRAAFLVPHEVRRYAKNKDDLSKYAIRQLANQLADALTSYMRLDVEEDPYRQVTIVRGTIRVIPPDHRF